MIVDASVVLRAFFPAEEQARAQALIRDHVSGRIRLFAPTLLLYELSNAVLLAMRRGRVTWEQARDILHSFEGLRIEMLPVTWLQMLSLARELECTAYDAAYLALAKDSGRILVTADLRLFRAVRGRVDWILWLGDYGCGEE